MIQVVALSGCDHTSDIRSVNSTGFFAYWLAEASGLAACFAVADAADRVCLIVLHPRTP